jgi:hypothetical protein
MGFTKKEAHVLMRLQVAMWLPAACYVCKKPYADVDDFLARDVRAGPGWRGNGEVDMEQRFVDDACYTEEVARAHQ